MGVESNFELYTFLWGWHQYEAIWNILKDTGIAFIPFVGMILNAFISAYGSQDPGQAAFATIRNLEISLFTTLIVILIAVQPLVKVDVSTLEYVQICVGSKFIEKKSVVPEVPSELGLGRIKMTDFEEVRLPAWWFGVLSISHGIVHAAKKGIPCVNDIRQLRIAVHNHSFKDLDTINDLMRFGNECYLKALSKFNQHEQEALPTTPAQQAASKVIKKGVFELFGSNDIAWMGSQYFYLNGQYYLKLPGFSTKTINDKETRLNCVEEWQRVRELAGFAISDLDDPVSDENIIETFQNQIADMSEINVPNAINTLIQVREGGIDIQEYVVNHTLLRAVIDANIAFDPISFAKDPNWGFMYRDARRFASDVGQTIQEVSHYATIDYFIKSIPFVGATMLMAMYVFLPLGLVFSSYSLQFLLVGSLGIFGVKFYFYLWHVVWWLDQNMMLMIAKNDGTLNTLFEGAHQSHETTIGLVVSTLYFLVPLLWTMVVTWAGYAGVQALSSAADKATAQAESIGQTVSSVVDRGFYQGVSTGTGIAVGTGRATKWFMFEKKAVMDAQKDFELGKKALETLKKETNETIKQVNQIIKENERIEKTLDRYEKEKGKS